MSYEVDSEKVSLNPTEKMRVRMAAEAYNSLSKPYQGEPVEEAMESANNNKGIGNQNSEINYQLRTNIKI